LKTINCSSWEADLTTKLGNWLDERLSWRQVWAAIFLRMIPKVNWLYTLGSASLFLAVNQAFTGILLTFYYVPTPDHAYDSVQYITTQLPAGWLIRGLHHWGASAMVVVVVLHMLRVIFFGAYKYPREVTWFSGVFLLLVTIGFGFTGYLLPWDQKAYWATIVGTRIAATPPWIGNWILLVIRGGEELSAVTLARFFGVHIWVLPAALLLFTLFHLYLVIRIGISAVPKREDG
jgi:quinol-cytochrome oxidoreductase complex cytochrome b subunit